MDPVPVPDEVLPAIRSAIRAALTDVADPSRAPQMAAYMKDRFPFLGVGAPTRRAACRGALARARGLDEGAALDLAAALWDEPEREFQYVACDLVRASARRWSPGALAPIRALVVSRSWWDTVDALARGVGDLVLAHPELAAEMDQWIGDDDIWVARVALLHQLGWRDRADADRLFRYCARRAPDDEFFIRKAVGWALRDRARTDPDGVRAFVAAHPELSGLSRREALKHIGPD